MKTATKDSEKTEEDNNKIFCVVSDFCGYNNLNPLFYFDIFATEDTENMKK